MTTKTKNELIDQLAGEVKTKENPDGFRTFVEAKEILESVGAYEKA